MLLLGKQITMAGEVLHPVSVEKVFRAIVNPYGEVATLQKRLQAIRMLDADQYRRLKTGLPYLVCAHFQPKIRKKENFVHTQRFILDVDHLSEFGLELSGIRNLLRQDPRIELLFASPGGDGLKALFKLSTPITDHGYYALFYKAFCFEFAAKYQLDGAVDTKTNDVSRCCFVSFDPEAYHNAEPETVDASAYMPQQIADLDALKATLHKQEKEHDTLKKEAGVKPAASAPLSSDILDAIKQKVGMRVKKPVPKEHVQPEELDRLMAEVLEQVSLVGATVILSTPISYGRKVRIGAGPHWAEVNLFYGARGVSIVGTTKTGSNKELCKSMVELLQSHFSNS